MIVDDIQAQERDGRVQRSARVRWNGGSFRLRIEVPSEFVPPEDDASPFLPATLLTAMRRHEDLEIDGAVDRRLLDSSLTVQSAYRFWNPEIRYCDVRVAAELPDTGRADGSGCFFSRGVDSTFAVMRNPRLSPLIWSPDLDTSQNDDVRRREERLCREAAEALGRQLLVVPSNVREFTDLTVDWVDVHGAALAFIGLSLSGGIARLLVPSTKSFRCLEPFGSDPQLDPLFSSRSLEVEHDTVAYTRTAKVAAIARERPELVKHLKVCFMEGRTDNCGRCPKCLHTMVCLRAAGALEIAEGFPDEIDLRAVASLRLYPIASRLVLLDDARALSDEGADGELRRALLRSLRRTARPGLLERLRGVGVEPPPAELTVADRFTQLLLSTLRDGRPLPPLGAPEDPLAGGSVHVGPLPERADASRSDELVGLVRALDRRRFRHRYGAGAIPPGEVVGELCGLEKAPSNGAVGVRITPGGYLATDRYEPRPGGASPPRVFRWALAPAAWRGFADPWTRAVAAVRRLPLAARALARRARPDAASELVGYLHPEAGPARVPVWSGVHPVMADQMVTTNRWEANDLGYEDLQLLGFGVRGIPLTARPVIPWASRLGQEFRSD